MVDTVEIPLLDEQQLIRLSSDHGAKVAFDDRGNAIWQFAPHAEGEFEAEESPPRGLFHPGLAVADEDPAESPTIRANVKGLRVGYNPYDSGQLERRLRRKPRNMRELSRWIELRRKLVPGND